MQTTSAGPHRPACAHSDVSIRGKKNINLRSILNMMGGWEGGGGVGGRVGGGGGGGSSS